MTRSRLLIPLLLLALPFMPGAASGQEADVDWPAYGGGPANLRYSPLAEVTRENVHLLERAWVYRTGEPGEMQCQPVVVQAVLYCTTARLKAFAVRADTGEELWTFDPFAETGGERPHVNRGVVYWEDGDDRRILYTAGPRLYALDAGSGRPIESFGDGGSVDLREGLMAEGRSGSVVATTPGALFGDLLLQGTRVSESEGAAPGHVRAYDVRTGAIRWTFHTIPRPGETGYETWPSDAWTSAGGANSWAGISVDTARGIAFVPTGSATPDFFGGARPGENLFANSLIALDAATGERLWHFQTVHHDLWDRDLPAPPNLVTVTHGGSEIDAVAQITKSGHLFLLDRRTGEPLFPVEERPVPPSDLPGEMTSPTQPLPTRPEPFARQRLTEENLTRRTPAAHRAVLERFRTLRSGGQYVPPSLEGTVVFPGFDGGGEWGGAAVDPGSGMLYVNASEMPWIARLVAEEPDSSASRDTSAAELYRRLCAGCHGEDLSGGGDRGPALRGAARLGEDGIRRIIREGAGFMPAFPHLTDDERAALAGYVARGGTPLTGVESAPEPAVSMAAAEATEEAIPGAGAPGYRFAGYERFLDPDGYPAVAPPWGTLSAIDLNRGEIRWQVTLGEFPELTAAGHPATGTENYGGPVVTAGGVVFIAATRDARIRAFDAATGVVLWQASLPAGGYATPAVYAVDGREYLVVAAGGTKMGTPAADAYVAYALPD